MTYNRNFMNTFPRLLLLLSLAVPLAAQQSEIDVESKEPAGRARAARQAAEKSEAAAKTRIEGDGDVDFSEVLQRPDDVALNERFARAQIRRGDLRGASSTLERLLLLRPGSGRTRLLYAVVLFRLDDLTEAERELALARKGGLPPDLDQEAKRYQDLISARRRPLHFLARVTAGVGWDDNRNAAPTSSTRLLLDNPVTLVSSSRRREDFGALLVGTLGARRDLGGPSKHSVFGDVTYYRAHQDTVDLLNLQAYTARAGATARWRGYELTPALQFDHVLLSQTSYLRSRGASLRAYRRLSRSHDAWLEFSHAYQDFMNSRLFSTAGDRTGDQFDWSAGAGWNASPADRFALEGVYRRKFSRRVFNAYHRLGADLDYTRLLGRGRFLMLGAGLLFDRYEQPETIVSIRTRSDDAWRLRASLGAPLSLFWRPLDGFTGILGVERFQQDSNLTGYSYENHRLSALVTYKWGT